MAIQKCHKRMLSCLVVLLLVLGSGMLVGPVLAVTQTDVTVGSNSVGSNNLSLGLCLVDEYGYVNNPARGQLAQACNTKMIRVVSCDFEPCTLWSDGSKTGSFNWATVDKVMQGILAIGAQPLITLGYHNAYGGWTLPRGMGINSATGLPNPDSFAAYCTQWVSHFRSTGASVRFYEIINEPWSYFGWNDYTKFGYYKAVFNAAAGSMRTVNPNVLVGFDGSNRKPVLTWWLSNGGANLDFISFHKYDASAIGQYSDATMLNLAETWQLQTDSSYYGVQGAQQAYYNARGKWLPAINSESNFNSAYATGTDPKIQQMVGAVWTALVLRTGILVGLNYNCYYSLESSASSMSSRGLVGKGFGMINIDNNQPWYPYYVYKMLSSSLTVGDSIVQTTSSLSNVRSLAWIHGTKLNLLLICQVDQTQFVQLHGLQGLMNYSKIDNTISWLTPRLQTGTIDSTQPIAISGYTVMLLQSDSSKINPSPSPSPTATFADGFESGNFATWTSTAGSPTVQSSAVHTGKYAMKNAGTATQTARITLSAGYSYYTRCYVFFDSLPTAGKYLDFLEITGGGGCDQLVGVYNDAGTLKWSLRRTPWATRPEKLASSGPSTGVWYCVELYVSTSGSSPYTTNEIVWINGQQTITDTYNAASGANIINVKVGADDRAAALTDYIDDVVVSSTYIGP